MFVYHGTICYLLSLICMSSSRPLPDAVFWNNKNWPSDLNGGELKGTVLFAQSQIIPSKHGIENDKQPHLTALRKTLVMFQPMDYKEISAVPVELMVRDADGTFVSGQSPIVMNNPKDITKHDGWVDISGEIPVFPPSLQSPYVIQGKSNLNQIGNDPSAERLAEILNTKKKEVQIIAKAGASARDIYVPDGSKIPADSKIEVTCKSGLDVSVHYPNTQTGGWRRRVLPKGNTLLFVLSDGGVWIAKEDLVHNEYIFGHGFYTAILDAEWVLPGMKLEFASQDGKVGTLEDIDIGGITEIMITAIDVGMLTEPRDEFTFQKDPTTHREYFETAPSSRLVVVEYEALHLSEVMLPTGKLYDTVSDTDGGWHSGDMRQFTGKFLISHGIDFANYGISSSQGQSNFHPFTCALFAAHNTVGMYQNGRVVHGGSGGNGIVTITKSVGNEMSHEIGHNYGLGHYPGGFEGSVHRSSDEINSSWGWDSQHNIFIPNFGFFDTGEDQCIDDQCQSPFLGKFQYGKDSMAGPGWPKWSNRYTLYTPYVSKIIQEFLESKPVWSPTSSTGFRKYDAVTRKMKEFINMDNGDKAPRLYRVPVTTIVGYYDPDLTRSLQSYIFPAMHGAYGFVYDDDGGSGDGSNYECELVVKTNNGGTLVFELSSAIDSKGMNKFHVNVATEDQPYEASIYCQSQLHTTRALDGPKGDEPLTYTVTGVPFNDETDAPPTPRPVPTESPTNSPTGDFTVYPNKSCKANKNLGTSFSSPVECSVAAKAEPGCTGKEIMWSEKHNGTWGCRCCYKHPTCPADPSRYKINSNWDVYEYEKCDGETNSPTNAPTSVPTVNPTSSPTSVPTSTPTDQPTLSPTTTLPTVESPTTEILSKYPNLACKRKMNLGTSFLTPEECAEAAKNNPSCTGTEIMWSEKHNWKWGCRCCYKHPTCPADPSRYKTNNKWDVYEYEKCDGDSIPTDIPTLTPTNAPTSVPTASPTNSPTSVPTSSPTNSPTSTPTNAPTSVPTASPTNSPTSVPTSSPTNSPTLTPTNAPTSVPTTSPEILSKYPNLACKKKMSLGTSFLSPEECAEAAKNNPSCTGTEIMWSEKFNGTWGCRCCYKHPTCPADPSRYKTNSNWDIYEYKKCEGDTN